MCLYRVCVSRLFFYEYLSSSVGVTNFHLLLYVILLYVSASGYAFDLGVCQGCISDCLDGSVLTFWGTLCLCVSGSLSVLILVSQGFISV